MSSIQVGSVAALARLSRSAFLGHPMASLCTRPVTYFRITCMSVRGVCAHRSDLPVLLWPAWRSPLSLEWRYCPDAVEERP